MARSAISRPSLTPTVTRISEFGSHSVWQTAFREALMFSHIYHFLKGPNPLHPSMWKGRLRPLTFRRFAVTDMPRCLELYALNEAGRFPEGVIEEYKKTLREQTSYFLVAEIGGQIIASGGVGYLGENTAVF